MPAAPRPPSRAREIAFAILGREKPKKLVKKPIPSTPVNNIQVQNNLLPPKTFDGSLG